MTSEIGLSPHFLAAENRDFDTAIGRKLCLGVEAGLLPHLHAVLAERGGQTVLESYGRGPDENWGRPLGEVVFENVSFGYDPRRPIRPWVFTIVRNRTVDLLRRSYYSAPVEQPPASAGADYDAAADPAEELAAGEVLDGERLAGRAGEAHADANDPLAVVGGAELGIERRVLAGHRPFHHHHVGLVLKDDGAAFLGAGDQRAAHGHRIGGDVDRLRTGRNAQLRLVGQRRPLRRSGLAGRKGNRAEAEENKASHRQSRGSKDHSSGTF